MMMVAQYQRILETLFGFFLNPSLAKRDSKMASGSGCAPRDIPFGLTVLEYGVLAAPS
jgi:hypothetical protein